MWSWMLELECNSVFCHRMQFCKWDFYFGFLSFLVAVTGCFPPMATKHRLIYLATLVLTLNLRVSAADKGFTGWCGFFSIFPEFFRDSVIIPESYKFPTVIYLFIYFEKRAGQYQLCKKMNEQLCRSGGCVPTALRYLQIYGEQVIAGRRWCKYST